jgi:hypothetical protein
MIQFNGREITAGGFTAHTFQRALLRAISQGLRAERGSVEGTVAIVSGGATYESSRDRCSCIAGRYYKPCKHRAMAAFLLDGLGLDFDKGVTSVRLRPQVVQGITGECGQKPTLTQRVRQGWTADRSWMKAYGIEM